MVKDATKVDRKPRKRDAKGKYQEIPLLLRLKARSLYLVQGLSHQEIANQTGLTKEASEKLASREGWTAAKSRLKQQLLRKHDTRMSEQLDSVMESIVSVSEQHAMRGLERVGNALERDDDFAARDFQSYTSGVKNLVGVIRDIRQPAATAVSSSTNVQVFVVEPAIQASPASEKQVKPVDVVTTTLQ